MTNIYIPRIYLHTYFKVKINIYCSQVLKIYKHQDEKQLIRVVYTNNEYVLYYTENCAQNTPLKIGPTKV